MYDNITPGVQWTPGVRHKVNVVNNDMHIFGPGSLKKRPRTAIGYLSQKHFCPKVSAYRTLCWASDSAQPRRL